MIKNLCKVFEKRINKKNNILKFYNKYYEGIVEKEIKISDIKSTDKVLCIGGGAVPCTALQIYKQSKAKVYVLEKDIQAIEYSKELIKKLKLENNIKILEGDGRYINPNKYDIIHIALQVEPKEEVLNNIWKKLDTGKKILIRKPKKILSRFYSKIPKIYSDKNLNKREEDIPFSTMSTPIILEKI